MRRIDILDQPLAMAAKYLDGMPGTDNAEACRAAAWRITDEHGGWALGNRILFGSELATVLERDLPLWLALAAVWSEHPDDQTDKVTL